MSLPYLQPGVSINELLSPSVSPLVAVPAVVCVIGVSQGYITQTDQIVLSGTTATALPNIPSTATLSSVVSVSDAIDPGIAAAVSNDGHYRVTTDYTVNSSAKTVTRVSSGVIPDGGTVNVTYQYVPSDYFEPIRLDEQSTVEARFGSSYSTDGTAVNSPLSYAASFAFENGASDVVLQPLFRRTNANDPSSAKLKPSGPQEVDPVTWEQTLFNIRDVPDINIIVPVAYNTSGVSDSNQIGIFQEVQDHIKFMKDDDQQYIIAIFGEDSSATTSYAQKATLRTHASTLQGRYNGDVNENIVFVSPSKFTRVLPTNLSNVIYVGGQFVAAGVAGMISARDVSSSLTRKLISGVRDVADPRTKSDKNTDAQSGLLVIEQKRTAILIRHGITIDTSSTAKREISIVRAKHRMIESVRDTLENNVIGQVVADGNAPFFVRSTVISVLENLKSKNDLVDYSDVQARTLSLDPTTIEVRFSYRPAFPVNYINVVFSLDLTSGEVATEIEQQV